MAAIKPHINQADIFVRFRQALADLGLPNARRQPIVLAVSGGGDSLGMAVLFSDWQARLPREKRHRLHALVVDHAIRADSATEAQGAVRQLAVLGIEAECRRISTPPPKTGVQAWARQQRYRLLTEYCRHKKAILATAHQADDQLETIEMRLMRHSGLRGLAGMAVDSMWQGVRLIRPCLNQSRQALHFVAAQANLTIASDPSNNDMRFLRPQLRRGRLARNKAGISDSQLLRLGRAARLISHGLDSRLAPYVSISAWGFGKLPAAFLAGNPDRFCHAAAMVAAAMGGTEYVPNQAAFTRLYHRLAAGKTSTATLAGCEWRVHGQDIMVLREAELDLPPIVAQHGSAIFDRRWLIRTPHNCKVRVEAIGSQRFAAIRRRFPQAFPQADQAPARAFWSLPILLDLPQPALYNSRHEAATDRLVLDHGAVFPYMRRDGTPVFGCQQDEVAGAVFIGAGRIGAGQIGDEVRQ